MRYLILTTSYPYFSEIENRKIHSGRFVESFVVRLADVSDEVIVLTNTVGDSPKNETHGNLRVKRFNYFISSKWQKLTDQKGIPENLKNRANFLLVPFYLFVAVLQGFWIVKKHKIKYISAHWALPMGLVGIIIAKLTNSKCLLTLYGGEVFPLVRGHYKLLRPTIRFILRNSDISVGISKATVDAAKSIAPEINVNHLPDGVDCDYFRPGEKDSQLLSKYCNEDSFIIFFSGWMVERKGHRFLIESIQFLRNKIANFSLIIGGEGPLLKDLKSLALFFDPHSRHIFFPGFLSEIELVPMLQSVDLYVLPSCIDKNGDTEGSATAALEAMACGTPAIISRVGGNVGAVAEGCGAFYSEPSNPASISTKLLYYYQMNEEEKQNQKQKARGFIEANYSWEKIVSTYVTLSSDHNYGN